MKKLLFFCTVIIMITAFTSCKKDKNPLAKPDVCLEIKQLNPSNSVEQVVVTTDYNTHDVIVVRFNLVANGIALSIDEVPVMFSTSQEKNIADIISNVKLVVNGSVLGVSNDLPSNNSYIWVPTIKLDSPINLNKGESVEVVVRADVNKIDVGTFKEGTILHTGLTSFEFSKIGATDSDGDIFTIRYGAAVGHDLIFEK